MPSLPKITLGLALLVAAAALIASSVADFAAQASNSANTFSSGTLVLSDAKTSGTTCLSTGGGTTDTNSNSTGCDNLINATGKKPGDTATSSVVTLRNVGSVAASSFKIWSSACTNSDASGETYHGTGDLCAVVALTLHDDTNNRCYYPTQTAGACVLDTTKTLSTFVTFTGSEVNALSLSTTGLSSGIAFTIQTQLVSTAGNSVQGRTATIDFNWKILQ